MFHYLVRFLTALLLTFPLDVVSADERNMVYTFLKLKNGEAVDFNTMSESLFEWSKKRIIESECD